MSSGEFENLFRILKLVGGKFIIVEDGRPTAVMMSYEEFQELAIPAAAGKLTEAAAKIEDINRQITSAQLLDLREEVVQDLPEAIRIEPLAP